MIGEVLLVTCLIISSFNKGVYLIFVCNVTHISLFLEN